MRLEKIALNIEKVTGTKEIFNSIKETNSEYVEKSSNVKISIPKNANKELTIQSTENEKIEMLLPKQYEKEKATKTDEGTITYGDTKDNTNIGIQALKIKENDETFDAVRVLISINNADAEKDYSFKYNLPKGYRLITDREYSETYASKEEKLEYEKYGICK